MIKTRHKIATAQKDFHIICCNVELCSMPEFLVFNIARV